MRIFIFFVMTSILSESLSRPIEQEDTLYRFYEPSTVSFQEQLLINFEKAMLRMKDRKDRMHAVENRKNSPTPDEIKQLQEAKIRFDEMNKYIYFGMPFYGGLYQSNHIFLEIFNLNEFVYHLIFLSLKELGNDTKSPGFIINIKNFIQLTSEIVI